ncbi:hypothetical protein [Kitasatospora sp. NPDC004531]
MTAEHRTPSESRQADPDLTERQEQHLGDDDSAPIVTPTPPEVKHPKGGAAEPKAETGDPDEPEPPSADVQAP